MVVTTTVTNVVDASLTVLVKEDTSVEVLAAVFTLPKGTVEFPAERGGLVLSRVVDCIEVWDDNVPDGTVLFLAEGDVAALADLVDGVEVWDKIVPDGVALVPAEEPRLVLEETVD